MHQKILYARDAVYVSKSNPHKNYLDCPYIHVGFVDFCPLCLPLLHRRNETAGLLQFEPFDLPDCCEITSARLGLFLCRAYFAKTRVQVFRNLDFFDGAAVTWATRPAVLPYPAAAFWAARKEQGAYIECDILPLVKEGGKCPGVLGLSLVPDREAAGAAAFSAQRDAFPPYLKIEYRCKADPPPCPGCGGIVENLFYERLFELEGAGELLTPAISAEQAQMVTFFVKNTGAARFEFHLQISPDGMNFIDDPQRFGLDPHEMKACTPYMFGRYLRVRVVPASFGQPVRARVWFQTQTNNYAVKRACFDP